jgi:broad specificity phosphatase PhoE
MKVYIVRHGSTDSLEKKISQPDNEPLNQKGKDQAKELGKRFAKTQLDLIVSSPHLRAVQTAKEIGKDIETNPLFAEVRKPKEVIGQSKEDEEIKAILQKIGQMYTIDPSWHYADEENFEDLKKRGLRALEFLKSLNKDNIVVVSHANFIALLAGLMLYGDNYLVDISLKLKNFLRLSNTGICIFAFEDGKWKLQCWNDTSHCLE